MDSAERLYSVRDGLVRAMDSGEVLPEGPELFNLAVELVQCAFPECPTPKGLDSFSLLVGHVAGSAVQKYEHLETDY